MDDERLIVEVEQHKIIYEIYHPLSEKDDIFQKGQKGQSLALNCSRFGSGR